MIIDLVHGVGHLTAYAYASRDQGISSVHYQYSDRVLSGHGNFTHLRHIIPASTSSLRMGHLSSLVSYGSLRTVVSPLPLLLRSEQYSVQRVITSVHVCMFSYVRALCVLTCMCVRFHYMYIDILYCANI